MKTKSFAIYRLKYRDDVESSEGFEFFSGQLAAETAGRTWKSESKTRSFEVEKISVVPTKRGIISALNIWAGHPDNG